MPFLANLLLCLVLSFANAVLADEATPDASFDSFVEGYRSSPQGERAARVETFVAAQKAEGGFPFVEADGTVVFVYVAERADSTVQLVGDFMTRDVHTIAWHEDGVAMTPIAEGANVFFHRLEVPRDAHLDYRYIVDGEPRTDPLNPHSLDGGIVGEISELWMPDIEPPSEIERRPEAPRGTVERVQETWAEPAVRVYLPPGYNERRRYPVVLTPDGAAWIEYLRLPTILDNLIAEQAIEPMIAVMVDTRADRRNWYTFNAEYLAYVERVVRHVDEHYSTRAEPSQRLHIGTSAGARAAFYVGFERPDLFHKLALLSPSFRGPLSYYEPYLSGRKVPDSRLDIWLCAGTYEGTLYDDARVMERYFEHAGLRTTALYTPEGHSFGHWRRQLRPALAHFFPGPASKTR